MSARDHYQTAAAFRTALEQRLRADAHSTGAPLNRLRKDAAFNRLLIRLCHAAPDQWALKGGLALIARIGIGVRGTKDLDTNWRATYQELEDTLTQVEDLDLDDWFSFQIDDARPLQGEGEAGALRYPITARLDGRIFEQLSLDANIVNPKDPRPVEQVTVQRNPFQFIDEPQLQIPMVTPSQQLAEKLHAYNRHHDNEANSRAKDLFDMLVIADQVQLPDAATLANAARQTFQVRATTWPPELAEPPAAWAKPWQAFNVDYPLQWNDLHAAYLALQQFWTPILNRTSPTNTTWNPTQWRWT